MSSDSDGPAPDATQPAVFDPADYRPCSGCGALVRAAAIQCRFCGADLEEGVALPEQVAQTAKKFENAEALHKSGDLERRAAAAGGRFRIRMWVVLILALLAWAAVALGASEVLRDRDLNELLIVLGAVFGFILTIVWAVILFQDLSTPPHHARTTAKAGFRAFFQAMRFGRWTYAYACTLPDVEPVIYPRPALDKVQVRHDGSALDSPRALSRYWKPMLRSSELRGRFVTNVRIETYPLTADYAMVHCRYKLYSYNSLIVIILFFCVNWLLALLVYFLTRKSVEVTLVKCMHRVGEQWYAMNGGIQSGEDLLPKLYHDCIDRLERGELPETETLKQAAQFVDVPTGTDEDEADESDGL